MHIKKIIVSAILGATMIPFANAQIDITVKGKVTGDTEGYNKIYIANQMSKDSTTIENGYFELTFTEPEPGTRSISLEYDRAKMRMFMPPVLYFDKSGTIELEFDIVKGLSSTKISGLESARIHSDFRSKVSSFYPEVRNKVIERYGKTAFDDKNDQYDEAMAYQNKMLSDELDALISTMLKPDALVSATLILTQAGVLEVDVLEKHYNKLSPEIQKSGDGRKIKAKIEGLKNAHIGALVKDFTLPNEKGEVINFHEFKGKYVMVDFWASWCSPCRASFPRIREVYKQLQNEGKSFEIVSISIDQNKGAWEKAVEQEQNPWPQLYDDNNISYSQFNVQAVPTIYLIDPEGKIVQKEVGFAPSGGGTMEKKLEEIFNTNFKKSE